MAVIRIHFDVAGIPRPAGSKRAFAYVRRGADGQALTRVTKSGKTAPVLGVSVKDDASDTGQAWRYAVQQAATAAMMISAGDREPSPPLDGAVQLVVCFRMPRPKGHLRKDGTVRPAAPGWPTTRPDSSKLLRLLEDSLRGIVWRDDAQVVLQTVMKVYTTQRPGCSVEISPMEDNVGRYGEEARESGSVTGGAVGPGLFTVGEAAS